MKLTRQFARVLALPVLALIAFGFPVTAVKAQDLGQTVLGTPLSYSVQILDASLCAAQDCATSALIYNGAAAQINIASHDPNTFTTVDQGGATVPPATYTHIRINVDRKIGVLGRIVFGGGDCITTDMSSVSSLATGLSVATGTGTPATTIFTMPSLKGSFNGAALTTTGDTLSIVTPFTQPLIVIAGGSLPQLGVLFDVKVGLGAANGTDPCVTFLAVPVIKITVDGVVIATINVVTNNT